MKKILIIEDEKPMAHALELKLKKEGYEVSTAGDGECGLAYLTNRRVDLILLDLIMPKLDGFGVLEALKAKKNKTPVIVLSNLSQDEDVARAKAFGAKGFFVKSNVAIADIVSHVKEILGP